MRLINTTTCKFEEFIGNNIPNYVILSHTWEEEEVSFQDYEAGNYRHKKGYRKIKMTLEIAREEDVQYAWVDTCCIDKKSSAELTEAINSMYRWYERSVACYVYLSDLEKGADASQQFSKCRWFTRGWTLQELIAPFHVHFYNSHWDLVGSRYDLYSDISRITGISEGVLLHRLSLSSICVAQKMSWAASRQTTRIEDMAYSLLGIFGVNMPLLYGEEKNAFRRLQEEIIKSRSDLSILAWEYPLHSRELPGLERLYCGFLAESPAVFSQCGDMWESPSENLLLGETTITNRGIRVLCTISLHEDPVSKTKRYILPLPHRTSQRTMVGLRLRKVGDDIFLREDPSSLFEYSKTGHFLALRPTYLAIQPPKTPNVNYQPRWCEGEPYLRHVRCNILELSSLAPVKLLDFQGIYDAEDKMFFSTSPISRSAIWLRFGLRLDVPGGTTEMHGYDIECLLYVIDWELSPELGLRYRMVDCKAYSSQVAAVQANVTNWELDPYKAEDKLRRHGIPDSRDMKVQIPNTTCSFRVYLQQSYHAPSQLSDRPYCRIAICYQKC